MLMEKSAIRRSEQLDDDFQYNFPARISTRSRERAVEDDYDILSQPSSQARITDDYSPTVPLKRPLENNGPSYSQNKTLLVEVQNLENQVKELTQLRKTDAELALKEYMEKAKLQVQASNNQIEALKQSQYESEKEIKELKAALYEAQNASLTVTPEVKDQASHKIGTPVAAPVQQLRNERDQYALQNIHNEPQNNAHLVRNMYEDLTGLLFTDIKETVEGNLFNCVQAGRKGTIHFKLFQPKDGEEIQYKPMLDIKRDAELIKSLPEYLTNEIEFKKDNASLFLWRLMSSLTRDSNR